MRPAPVAVTLGLVLAACNGGEADSGTVRVFAAASLTDAFTALEQAFEQAHAGTDVEFSFAGSSDLAGQIAQGAPADVFASADTANMERLIAAGQITGSPVSFATNRAEIIVEPGNPLGITGVTDLADPRLVLVVCADEVPCGAYAREVFAAAGIDPVPDSYEENVRGVVTKVTLGEADAGVAYATDVLAAGDEATGVPIPDEHNAVAEYPIAVTAEAPNPDGAAAFVEFVTGSAGQQILGSFGFGPP